jgi:hypothetical protein
VTSTAPANDPALCDVRSQGERRLILREMDAPVLEPVAEIAPHSRE